MIKLKNCIARTYYGHARYHVIYDYSSGSLGRYKVLLETADDPLVIGRELDLKTVKDLIQKYESAFLPEWFFGDRKTALKVFKKVTGKKYG
jgi:hypothetical protein